MSAAAPLSDPAMDELLRDLAYWTDAELIQRLVGAEPGSVARGSILALGLFGIELLATRPSQDRLHTDSLDQAQALNLAALVELRGRIVQRCHAALTARICAMMTEEEKSAARLADPAAPPC